MVKLGSGYVIAAESLPQDKGSVRDNSCRLRHYISQINNVKSKEVNWLGLGMPPKVLWMHCGAL